METIEGYLQDYPETRFTSSGLVISSFFIAKEIDSAFVEQGKVIAWQELAEEVTHNLEKDQFIYAKGYWKNREWDDDKGIHHSRTEFTAKNIWIKGEDGQPTDIMKIPRKELIVPEKIAPFVKYCCFWCKYMISPEDGIAKGLDCRICYNALSGEDYFIDCISKNLCNNYTIDENFNGNCLLDKHQLCWENRKE